MPAPDGAAAWAEAVSFCRDQKTYRAELRVRGRVGGTRVPSILIGTQLTPARIGLTAVAGPTIIFDLVGTDASANLHWREGNRLATAPAAEIIDAVVGLRISPATLLSLATGCAQPGLTFRSAERFDRRLIVTLDEGRAELLQTDRWRVRAADARGLGVRYDAFEGHLPQAWRMWSGDPDAPAAELEVRASGVEASPDELGADAFPFAAQNTVPMTLDELRRLVRRE